MFSKSTSSKKVSKGGGDREAATSLLHSCKFWTRHLWYCLGVTSCSPSEWYHRVHTKPCHWALLWVRNNPTCSWNFNWFKLVFFLFVCFSTKHYKIRLSQVQKCHVINFEQHLLHVVLSHCQYSLKTGFGTDVAYDLPALEKHIVDRFIHGKPEIDVNIPVISFKADVVQTTGFAKVRKSIPQVNINQWHSITIV